MFIHSHLSYTMGFFVGCFLVLGFGFFSLLFNNSVDVTVKYDLKEDLWL